MDISELKIVVKRISTEIFESKKPRKIKIRTFIKYFNLKKRTSENFSKITELFSEHNILINPSILRIGGEWNLSLDDKIFLIPKIENESKTKTTENTISSNANNDPWFEEIKTKIYRTEKEVENKFIIPLLFKLGYTEDDRYDGMMVNAAHGSKPTLLELDFALYDKENISLENICMLIVEAKKVNKLDNKTELEKAQNQLKSYAYFSGAHFGILTDSTTFQIINLYHTFHGANIIFSCQRHELKNKFDEIYNLISKEKLSDYYENFLKKINE